jgi:protein subunit release factor A
MIPLCDLRTELIYTQTGTATPPGGQQAGMPHSSVRITHKPTGLMAQSGFARSQHKNKNIALAMLEYGLAELGWNL